MILKTNIFKFQGNVTYEHLLTPHIPFDLCYINVLISCCDTLLSLYSKFSNSNSNRSGKNNDELWKSTVFYKALLNIDKKMMDAVIIPATKEVDVISRNRSDDIFETLRSGIP